GGGGVPGTTSGACCALCPTASRTRSHSSGRGSTDPTIWLSTPRRNSHDRTIAVNSESTAIMASTCARSSASSVPSAYSAAIAIWSSLYSIYVNVRSSRGQFFLKTKALPNIHHAPPQPRLHCVHGGLELRRQLLPAPAVVVSEQHQLLAVRLEPSHAFQQALQFLRHFPASQRIRAIGRDF